MSVNKVILLGNIGKDVELKTFDNGGQVANVSIACSERGYTAKDGREVPEKTEWINLVFHGKLAEIASRFVKKGDKLYVEGSLGTRSYEGSDGQTKYVTEVHVRNMDMLGGKQEGYVPPSATTQPETMNYEPSEDLPF